MKIVILAAGSGSRIFKQVNSIPKCLLDFGGETILERQIRLYKENGIDEKDIVVVAGYMSEEVCKIHRNTIINPYYFNRDNAYSLLLALENIDEDILVVDGDIVFDEDDIHTILTSRNNNTLFCRKNSNCLGNTGVIVNKGGYVCEIGKHISNDELMYLGIMFITGSSLPVVKDQLKANSSNLYTVAINNCLSLIKFEPDFLGEKVLDINDYYDYILAKDLYGCEKMRILVLGASGLLGEKIYKVLSRDYRVKGTANSKAVDGLDKLDVTSQDALRAYFELYSPHIVINCVAMPDPEVCEENRDTAYKINVEAVKYIVDACENYGAKLIHFSTDYVFDGDSYEEYTVTSDKEPKNYYGYTKKMAEDYVIGRNNHLIIRIPIIYGFNTLYDKRTFPIKVIEELSKGNRLFLDNKQIRYPVIIDDIANLVNDYFDVSGILQITSNKGVTKYEWAKIIADEFGFDKSLICEVNDCKIENRPLHTKMASDIEDKILNIYDGTAVLKKQMGCVFNLIYGLQPNDYFQGISVGKFRYDLGSELSKLMDIDLIGKTDIVVPIPRSGMYYAMGLAQSIKKPFVQALFKEESAKRTYQLSSSKTRKNIINKKIYPIKEMIKDKNIILIDEAIFTGTTLKTTCDMCKACGAKSITIMIPTPKCWHRCRYNMRPNHVLLLENYDSCELEGFFGVDRIIFQSEDIFSQMLRKMNNICNECFIYNE